MRPKPHGASTAPPLGAAYARWQSAWEALGYPAFAAMLAVFFLMVNKPGLWGT